MMVAPVLLLLAAQLGCAGDGARASAEERLVANGEIAGRICDPEVGGGLEGAHVYVIPQGMAGQVAPADAWTDPTGRFLIQDLPGDTAYDLFVQDGADRLVASERVGLWLEPGEHLDVSEPSCGVDPQSVGLGLVSGDFDDLEMVALQGGFDNVLRVDGGDAQALAAFLASPEVLWPLDAVLFDAGHAELGVLYADAADDEARVEAALDGLRAYVDQGGVVIATAQAWDLVARAWPGRLAFLDDDGSRDSAQVVLEQLVLARVMDASLAGWLDQDELELELVAPATAVQESTAGDVSIHLLGAVTAQTDDGVVGVANAVLAASFSSGHGRVLYLSFPLEPNLGAGSADLLTYFLSNL